MQCCAAVRAASKKQQTPQLWIEGSGEGCGFFSSLKLPYLSTMSQQFCRRLLVNKGFITWSKKDFFSRGTTAGNRERARWPQFGRSGSQSEHRIRFSINWVQALPIDYVDVAWETGSIIVSNCTMGWSWGTQFCVASVLICNKEAISVPRKNKTYFILLSAFLSSSVCSFNFSSSYIGRKGHS